MNIASRRVMLLLLLHAAHFLAFVHLVLPMVVLGELEEAAGVLDLRPIRLSEECAANAAVANLTELLLADELSASMAALLGHGRPFKLDSMQMSPASAPLNDYFAIDLKKFKLNELHQAAATPLGHRDTLITHSLVMLKTSSGGGIGGRSTRGRLDREYMCQVASLCACEHECRLVLHFVAKLSVSPSSSASLPAQQQQQPQLVLVRLRLPLVLADTNDNKPFFYQPRVAIDIDLAAFEQATELLEMPLRLAADLDSTSANRVTSYTLESLDNDGHDDFLSSLALVHLARPRRIDVQAAAAAAAATTFAPHRPDERARPGPTPHHIHSLAHTTATTTTTTSAAAAAQVQTGGHVPLGEQPLAHAARRRHACLQC